MQSALEGFTTQLQELVQPAVDRFVELGTGALTIWNKGGWAMYPLAFISFVMFAIGVNVFLRLREKGFQSVPEKTWRRWIDHPFERRGPIGELLDFVTGSRTLEENTLYFEQLRTSEVRPFARDLLVMRIFVSAAPLVGLLGTVTGMLRTFGALASGSGGDQTLARIAAGISEALITTETGLVIAIPGLFFQYQLARTHERYKAFLAHLETRCTQNLYRSIRQEEKAAAKKVARKKVAEILKQKLQERPELSKKLGLLVTT